jgi:hypothetical protein
VRAILLVIAVLFAILGGWLFVAPGWASENFAWKISPFVAMTMGGWCLGSAWAAFVAARKPAALAFPPVLYLAAFGLFEVLVLIAFRDRLSLANPLAWLYLAALAAALVGGTGAVVAILARGEAFRRVGPALSPAGLAMTALFVVAVGVLAAYALTRGPVTRPTVFPEPMSLFTLRSFGAFYAALTLAAAPLLVARGLANALAHGAAMYGLIVAILAATFWFWPVFDTAGHPLQWIYVGAYVVVGAATAFWLVRHGTGREPAPAVTAAST